MNKRFVVKNRRCLGGAFVFLLVAGWQLPAFAERVLEEVIVSAQKREQSLQEVPISIAEFSGEMLQQSGVKDMFDLQVNTPGLVVDQNQSATTSNFNIRGIGTSAQNFGLESSVGLYVDGVYRSRQGAMINDLVDMNSISVLRGPQGTLFGRNSPAGAILMTTVKPDHEGTGFIEATLGNYDLRNISGAASFSAIPDVLAFRGTAFSSERDGWMDDIGNQVPGDDAINTRDRYGLRFQALFTPNDALEIRVIADYSEIDEICCGTTVVQDNNQVDQRPIANFITGDIGPRTFFTSGSDSLLEANGGTLITGDRVFDNVAAYSYLPVSQNEDSGLSVEINWDLEAFTLTSVTAWREFESFDNIDSDFTDLDVLAVDNKGDLTAITQEFRISGTTDELTYVAGAYFFTQDLDSVQNLHAGEDTYLVASVFVDFPLPPSAFPANGFSTNISEQEQQAWAIFGQVDWQLQDDLILTLGLRYTEEEKELNAFYTQTNPGIGFESFPPLADRLPITGEDGEFDDENVQGTIKLSWNANDDTLFYASYGTGYKSGGTNTDRIPQLFDTVFEAETSESYEVGMKADFPEQALRLNVAIYMAEFDDYQVNTFNGTGFNLRNAATATSEGLEIDLLWQATESLTLTAAYAHTEAEFDEFEQGNCWLASPFRGTADPGGDGTLLPEFCSRAGGRIGTNPEDFFVTTARQEFNLSDGITGFVHGEVTYTGEQMMESSNDPFEEQDAYTLVNLRLGVIFESIDTEVTLWGRNITDEEYYGTNFDPPIQDGKLSAYAREPATYGITARKSF